MRRLRFYALACALSLSCGSPRHDSPASSAGGEDVLPDGAWADVVIGDGRGRAALVGSLPASDTSSRCASCRSGAAR